jgi:hypothetical protein
MDKFTVKIMSYSCKMADITEEGVSCKLAYAFFLLPIYYLQRQTFLILSLLRR